MTAIMHKMTDIREQLPPKLGRLDSAREYFTILEDAHGIQSFAIADYYFSEVSGRCEWRRPDYHTVTHWMVLPVKPQSRMAELIEKAAAYDKLMEERNHEQED